MNFSLIIYFIYIYKFYKNSLYNLYILLNKKLVINSPKDHIASLTVKLAACFKGATVLGFGGDKLL